MKSKLFDAAMSDLLLPKESLPGQDTLNTYFLDVAAAVRSIVGKPDTIRELATRILQMIPPQYTKVFLVCDTYQQNSIKAGEREARGASNRYFLASQDMKMPYDFAVFLRNGSNKEMLFNLIQQAIVDGKSSLQGRTIFFSNKRDCMMINEDQASLVPSLSCNHEEADTNFVALVCAANVRQGDSVMVQSPSADVDILTLFVSHNFGDITIYIDNGTGKNRKIINVTFSELSAREKIALIGLHAFSRNDYVSAFFRKGKCAFWKAMLKQSQFLEALCHLGKELEVTNDLLFKVLEKFLCFLYGFPKHEELNALCRSIFWNKFKKKKQVVDLSLLPPCLDNLQFHVMRANYVGYIFRNADRLFMDVDDPTLDGTNK